MSMTRGTLLSLALLGLLLLPSIALADLQVQVGYADNLRPSPFFPTPWCGDVGTTFDGSSTPINPCTQPFDSGAIRLINNSANPVSVSAVSVNVGGAITAIWNAGGAFTIAPGTSAILAQTLASNNFDSSDMPFGPFLCCVNDLIIPNVTITADAVTKTLFDTGQVLNTSGVDFACESLAATGLCTTNESFAWRDIGTFGGQAGVPEPSTLLLLGSGLVGLVGIARRKLLD